MENSQHLNIERSEIYSMKAFELWLLPSSVFKSTIPCRVNSWFLLICQLKLSGCSIQVNYVKEVIAMLKVKSASFLTPTFLSNHPLCRWWLLNPALTWPGQLFGESYSVIWFLTLSLSYIFWKNKIVFSFKHSMTWWKILLLSIFQPGHTLKPT